jgi:hypothetical protein
MDSYMAEDLLRWRRQSVYESDDHYVFASETMRGKPPYWPDNLMKRHIQPVARAIGIRKKSHLILRSLESMAGTPGVGREPVGVLPRGKLALRGSFL